MLLGYMFEPGPNRLALGISGCVGLSYVLPYTRRFAATILSATQRCNIVSNSYNVVLTLQRCVALKIVVLNRLV